MCLELILFGNMLLLLMAESGIALPATAVQHRTVTRSVTDGDDPAMKGVGVTSENIVQVVPAGRTVYLNCTSMDSAHNFMFWQLADDTVIGPDNYFDSNKYKYEILTGKLFIKNVSPKETGKYKCVSQGVSDSDVNIRSVEMVVKEDWDTVYEDDTDTNLLRALIVIIAMLILLWIGFIAYSYKPRFQGARFLESSDDEDDSAEDVFTAPRPSTSKAGRSNIVLNQNTTRSNGNIETPGFDTDFNAVFAAIQTPEPLKNQTT